jgi:malate dehydrogenase (oxaloacetate-decarboxylating)
MACFNDDVQGTGCVTLAAIMAGLHVTKQKLSDVRMVVFGAGTAGVGIADQVRDAIATEGNISHEEASKKIWYVVFGYLEREEIVRESLGIQADELL